MLLKKPKFCSNMFRLGGICRNYVRPYMKYKPYIKVTVVGASSPLGHTVSLLLKQNPRVGIMTLFDFSDNVFPLAMDVSHIPREPIVEGCNRKIDIALPESDVVVLTGGKPRKRGQSDLCLFQENADFIITTIEAIATHCPQAFIVIAVEPINFTVALASKVLQWKDAYDKRKIFGVTLLDTMRARVLLSNVYNIPSENIRVPIICGHSSTTIIPMISHIVPKVDINESAAATITEAIRLVDYNITRLMSGYGETSLTAAYATYCTTSAILDAMNGFAIEHVAFVANNDYDTKYFASPIVITREGLSGTMQFERNTILEQDYISSSIEELAKDVQSAELYYTPTIQIFPHSSTKKISRKIINSE